MKEEGEEVIEKLEGKVEDIVKEVLEEYFKKKKN